MKTKKLFAAALILALALSACSNDDETTNLRDEVKITATIGSVTDNLTRATFENDGSGEFQAGDEYTLFYLSPTLGVGGSFPYEIGRTTLYWDEISRDGNPIDFLAWYPVYVFSGSLTQPYKVAGAATEATKDLLMAPKVTVAKNNTVNLQFGHVMHKLVVALGSNYYTAADLESSSITIKNLKSNAMIDFINGVVDETAATGTDPYPSATGSFVEFIVAPQTLTAGTEIIEILIEGKTFSYKIPATLTVLESGKQLKLMLMLTRYGVELQTGSIAPWGNQDAITDEIIFK